MILGCVERSFVFETQGERVDVCIGDDECFTEQMDVMKRAFDVGGIGDFAAYHGAVASRLIHGPTCGERFRFVVGVHRSIIEILGRWGFGIAQPDDVAAMGM